MATRANNPSDIHLPHEGIGRASMRARPSRLGLRLGIPLVVGIALLVMPLGGVGAHVAAGNHPTAQRAGSADCSFSALPPGTPQPIGTPQAMVLTQQPGSPACPPPPGCGFVTAPGAVGTPPPLGTPPPMGTPPPGASQPIGGGVSIGLTGQAGAIACQICPVASSTTQECSTFPGCGFVPLLKVTDVSGNTITGTTLDSATHTISVDSSTTYTEAAATASLADVHPGSRIMVRGTCSKDGNLQATAVTIVLPQVTGVVTAVNGSTLTVTGLDAIVHTIGVDATTRYQRAGQDAALSDISTGALISAEGNKNSDGSLSAVLVQIQLPHLAGKVTAVNGDSITLSTPDGASATVVTSASTSYETGDAKTATSSSISTGSFIVAEGTISADESTLHALRVRVLPGFGAGMVVTGGDLPSLGTSSIQGL